MKRILIFFIIIFISFSAVSSLYAVNFQDLLEKADSLVSFPGSDFSAKYTIVRDVPGEGRNTTECAIFRRDSEEKYVILITEPEMNRGQGYLKQGETLWFYDPESRKFNSTSSKNRFQNTNARNSDFTQSTLAQDYEVVKGERVTLGRYDCWLLNLKANNDRVTYPIMNIWISDDGLVRKTEDFSLSGQLLRTTAIPVYQSVEKKFVPRQMLIVENLEGAVINSVFIHEKTQITITQPAIGKQPDSVYSKIFLERMAR